VRPPEGRTSTRAFPSSQAPFAHFFLIQASLAQAKVYAGCALVLFGKQLGRGSAKNPGEEW